MDRFEWVHPKTITGPAAEGESYLRRPYLNEEFWREIEKGSHILFIAPRRVGKTSVMKDLVANPKDGYDCIFENVESDKSIKEFFKRLYFLILNKLSLVGKTRTNVERWLKGRGIEELSFEGGVKFKEKDLDFKNELLLLIQKLPELDRKIVLFLDEFSEVISAIRRIEGDDNAIEVLHTIREIRQKKEFRNCTFVLAGSIGLEHVVGSLDRLKLINDLHPVRIESLSRDEAMKLITQLTHSATVKYNPELIEIILDRIEHLIPYFIQLMVEEIDVILHKEGRYIPEVKDIETAFESIVKKNTNLNDWKDRLNVPYIRPDETLFSHKILLMLSHNGSITIQEIYNEVPLLTSPGNYMDIVFTLIRDGYISEKNEGIYKFTSPLLKAWWKKQHPIY
ncbi:MAG: hypothetical protein V1775_19295 [Bacteroidota bacterium]